MTRLIIPNEKETTFINAYIEAIYFTETGDVDQPQKNSKLDEFFERESIIDCLAFYSRIELYLPTDSIAQAGHDFWLTRNGHGSGFWDRKEIYGNLSDTFTLLSKEFGQVDSIFYPADIDDQQDEVNRANND